MRKYFIFILILFFSCSVFSFTAPNLNILQPFKTPLEINQVVKVPGELQLKKEISPGVREYYAFCQPVNGREAHIRNFLYGHSVDGMNLYCFVNGNLVNYVDPLGLQSWSDYVFGTVKQKGEQIYNTVSSNVKNVVNRVTNPITSRIKSGVDRVKEQWDRDTKRGITIWNMPGRLHMTPATYKEETYDKLVNRIHEVKLLDEKRSTEYRENVFSQKYKSNFFANSDNSYVKKGEGVSLAHDIKEERYSFIGLPIKEKTTAKVLALENKNKFQVDAVSNSLKLVNSNSATALHLEKEYVVGNSNLALTTSIRGTLSKASLNAGIDKSSVGGEVDIHLAGSQQTLGVNFLGYNFSIEIDEVLGAKGGAWLGPKKSGLSAGPISAKYSVKEAK